jgi:hypothetical protein
MRSYILQLRSCGLCYEPLFFVFQIKVGMTRGLDFCNYISIVYKYKLEKSRYNVSLVCDQSTLSWGFPG